ncbi:MAG TPA: dTMP kinase [bacterium]|nr:dTMP kinase [bacterium]HPL95482.1 dTMP kinase [bacterium]
MNHQKPFFVVFEGIDKSGKDTQADLLVKYIKNNLGKKVFFTFEPTRSNVFGRLIHLMLAKHIKISPLFFQRMYYWDRCCHVRQIKRRLNLGYTVICCRYFFSTIAYGYSAGINPQKIVNWHKKMPLPDLVFYLEIEAAEAMRRLKKQGAQGELFEKKSFLNKVIAGYNFCRQKFPDIWQTIPAQGNQISVFEHIRTTFIIKT